jgi:peptide/nickel transport system substrate-binding protein
MNTKINVFKLALILPVMVLFSACGGGSGSDEDVVSKRAGINEVVVHIPGDAQGLNTLTTSDATSSQILTNINESLLYMDDDTYEYVPFLAVSRPNIEMIEEGEYAGGMKIDFEIRPEATWDNGTPITGHDYAFTLKIIKCPTVYEVGHYRPYFSYIDDVIIDEENPKKFSLLCNKVYILAESAAGGLDILPAYHYDPKGLLAKFSVKELNNPANTERLKQNQDLIDFAKEFTSEKYMREPGFVVGSGPYKFDSWQTGQRITLSKKANWWANDLVGTEKVFSNLPDKIIYEVIVDDATTVSAVRDESVDVCRSFPSKIFVEDLMKNKKFQQKFNLHTPPFISYSYLGINMRNPKFADRRVRQALAMAYDVDYVIDVFSYGLAERTIGPFHPSTKYYNHDIVPYPFDLDRAAKLLDEAGWIDTDGDGVRDKMISGKKVPLEIAFKYVPGSPTTESILLLYQKNLQEIGIKMTLETREWTIYLDELDKHNFEMYIGAWVTDPGLSDPFQLWHTESYNGGSNYVGFGNAETDALIEKIQVTLDETERNKLYKKFQEILHEEVPYIFTSSPLKKIAIHRRFENADGKATRIGYVVRQFELNPTFGFGAKKAQAE